MLIYNVSNNPLCCWVFVTFSVPGGIQKLSPGTNISPQGPSNYASAMMPPPTFLNSCSLLFRVLHVGNYFVWLLYHRRGRRKWVNNSVSDRFKIYFLIILEGNPRVVFLFYAFLWRKKFCFHFHLCSLCTLDLCMGNWWSQLHQTPLGSVCLFWLSIWHVMSNQDCILNSIFSIIRLVENFSRQEQTFSVFARLWFFYILKDILKGDGKISYLENKKDCHDVTISRNYVYLSICATLS